MIQIAMALLVGFLLGWLFLLRRDISFNTSAAVIMFALLESISYGWLMLRKQRLEAEPRPINTTLIWRFVVASAYGLVVLAYGDAINEDLKLVALLPIASVFLVNLYKIVSNSGKSA